MTSRAAPEYLLTWQRTLSTDIYSLGIVLLELALRDNAYSTHFLQKYESDRGFDSFAVGRRDAESSVVCKRCDQWDEANDS